MNCQTIEFIALNGGNTAALTFDDILLDERWILSEDGPSYIAQTRPPFLGYQFGLAFGLAQRSLEEVGKTLKSSRSVLEDENEQTSKALDEIRSELYQGLKAESFIEHPRQLFQLRIDIVDVVANSLLLELQASGGRGYFKRSTSNFARRWREGAFLPIISPSAVQLRHILSGE